MKSLIQFLLGFLLLLAIWSWPVTIATPPPANAVTSVDNFTTAEEWLNKFPKQLGEYRKAIKETALTNADFARMTKEVDTLTANTSSREHADALNAMHASSFPGPVLAWFYERPVYLVLFLTLLFVAGGYTLYVRQRDF